MRIRPATDTFFSFPVTDEVAIHHDKGDGARWHVARDERGGIVASDGWRVLYATDYGHDLEARTGVRLAWDNVPPLYVQSIAYRLACGTLSASVR